MVQDVFCKGTCVIVVYTDGQVSFECAGRVPATVRAHFPWLFFAPVWYDVPLEHECPQLGTRQYKGGAVCVSWAL
jgi:hypothetical protein